MEREQRSIAHFENMNYCVNLFMERKRSVLSMAKGLDVSYAQGKPDWAVVKATGKVDFVFAKATQGVKVRDSSFVHNWNELKKAGILRGAYHFYNSLDNPVSQAKFFYSVVGKLEDDDLSPVLDFEVERKGLLTTTQVAKNIRTFIEHAEALFKRKVIVYTGGPLFDQETKGGDQDDLDFISDRDLWLAAYVVSPNKFVPKEWSKKGKSWVIWQLSGDKDAQGKPGLRLPGIVNVVDNNVTQGAANDLITWRDSGKIIADDQVAVTPHPVVDPSPTTPSSEVQTEVPSAVEIESIANIVKVESKGPTGILGYFFALIRYLLSFFRKKES